MIDRADRFGGFLVGSNGGLSCEFLGVGAGLVDR